MKSENEIYRWYADVIVYRLFGPLIASFGFLGGILSLIVFRRKSLRKKSCSIYFFYLALADLLCMICWLIHFVLPTYNIHLLTISNLTCKIFVFSMYFAFDLANYILTVCSLDRAMSVLFPIGSRRFCHRKMAFTITFILGIVLTILNSHLFYGFIVLTVQSINNDPILICHHRIDSIYYRKLFTIYDSYVDVIKTNVIPFIIMTICNLIIIIRVCRSNSSSNSTRTIKSKRKHEKDRQLTLMLLGSSMAFLILTLPTEINDIIRTNSSEHLVNEKTYLLSAILLSLAHLNYAIHFYIYTLTGEVFRQQLMKLWPIDILRTCLLKQIQSKQKSRNLNSSKANIEIIENQRINGKMIKIHRETNLDLSLITTQIQDKSN